MESSIMENILTVYPCTRKYHSYKYLFKQINSKYYEIGNECVSLGLDKRLLMGETNSLNSPSQKFQHNSDTIVLTIMETNKDDR